VSELNPRRTRLAASLKRLRHTAALSQTDMARRTGWVQPKVSRLETGAQLPTEDDIRTWAAHTYAPAEQIEALLDMLSAAHVEYTPTADLLKRGALARRQAHIGAMEAAAGRIGEYQPAFIPGLLQVPAYSRALLDLPGSARSKGASDAEFDQTIAARARRQELLREPGRRWQFVIGEPALWSAPGGLEVQETQLDHLVVIRELPAVELGVVPLRTPMPVMPLSGFRVLDEEFVFVESLAGEQRLEGSEITPILRAFETVRHAAVMGAEMVALIERVRAKLHGKDN
jgi:transcriptional regulator with XRE-family HTH domain